VLLVERKYFASEVISTSLSQSSRAPRAKAISEIPFNLFLLPLLGGFIFVRYWNRTKYHAMRADKERIILFAAVAGLVALVIAFILRSLAASFIPCEKFPNLPCLVTWWDKHVPFPYSDVSVIAFTLGAVLWIPLNKGVLTWIGALPERDSWEPLGTSAKKVFVKGWPYLVEGDRVVAEDGDPLNMLLRRAGANQKTLSLTLKSGKVYVGFLSSTSPPGSATRSIGLVPTRSGYRHPLTKDVAYTINYADALSNINQEIDIHERRLQNIENKIVEVEAQIAKDSTSPEVKKLQSRISRLQKRRRATVKRINRRDAILLDFRIVIPVEEISSISIYREDVRERYFSKPLKASKPLPAQDHPERD
jgi:hypothetical protein